MQWAELSPRNWSTCYVLVKRAFHLDCWDQEQSLWQRSHLHSATSIHLNLNNWAKAFLRQEPVDDLLMSLQVEHWRFWGFWVFLLKAAWVVYRWFLPSRQAPSPWQVSRPLLSTRHPKRHEKHQPKVMTDTYESLQRKANWVNGLNNLGATIQRPPKETWVIRGWLFETVIPSHCFSVCSCYEGWNPALLGATARNFSPV